MKIGIVTYHRSHNYGALLQAIATRNILEKFGHDAFYIDYWPDYHRQMYALFSVENMMSRGLHGGLEYLKNVLLTFNTRKKKIGKTMDFISRYINPYAKSENEEFDAVVYGSDQIWRKQRALKGYNPVYFGQDDFRTKRKIAFSASMGMLPTTEQDKEKVKTLLGAFDAISVRESDLLQFLSELGFPNVFHTLDPTLLLSSEEWDGVLGIKDGKNSGKYILFYELQKDAFDINQLRDFAERHGLKLKIITHFGVSDESGKIQRVTDPKDFVALIRNSRMVFTSSFHGLAFSIIYGKPVFAAYKGNGGRAASLLKLLGMDYCLLQPMGQIPASIPEVDYQVVHSRLAEKRNETLDFLKSNVQAL